MEVARDLRVIGFIPEFPKDGTEDVISRHVFPQFFA
jgi:hypothetical protein